MQRNHAPGHAHICFIAGTMHAMTAADLGCVTVVDGLPFDATRHVDRSPTTPLPVFGLGLTAILGA